MGTPSWVLLRGLSRAAGHWGDVPRRLARATGRPVHCLDLPGNGSAAAQASPVAVRDMVAHLQDEIAARGLAGPFDVVGLSMGAMVACEWAASAAGLRSAVLVNGSLRGLSPFHHRLRPSAYPALLRLAFTATGDHRWEETIFDLTSRRPALRAEVMPAWLQLRRAAPVRHVNVLRQLLAAARFRAPASPPPLPMLVVRGGGDQLVDPRCSAAIATRWQLPLQTHPTAGHDLPLDEPAWLVDVLMRWQALLDDTRRAAQAA
jgi:pimeloyl-ACP methyl ester carboxylesterase